MSKVPQDKVDRFLRQIHSLSASRDAHECAKVLVTCATRLESFTTPGMCHGLQERAHRAWQNYHDKLEQTEHDEIAEYYDRCRAELNAWRDAIDWARALGCDVSVIRWLEQRAEQAANTGD